MKRITRVFMILMAASFELFANGLHANSNVLAADSALPKAGEVFARHILESGGAAAFAGVRAISAKGTFKENNASMDFDLSLTAAGEILFVGKPPEGWQFRFGRTADGRTWIQRMSDVRDMPDNAGSLPVSLAMGLFPTMRLPFLRDLATATCTEEKDGDRGLWVIAKPEGMPIHRMAFDKGSGLLRGLEYARYDDYRSVEGLRLPFNIQFDRVSMQMAEIRLNPPMDAAQFKAPVATTGAASGEIMRNTAVQYRTQLSPDGKLSIVNRPMAANFGRGTLPALPRYDATNQNPSQIDLRGFDASGLDLGDRIDDLRHATFDAKTRWTAKLPAGFSPDGISEKNKNPGLGVRALHARGITGKGVGIGIIDQALLTEHAEYADRLRLYEEIHLSDGQAQMHGPAVASIAVGKSVGVAPAADLYYIAETHGTLDNGQFERDFTWVGKSIERLLDINKTLPPERRIRVISISVGWEGNQKGGAEADAAVERAKREGVFVICSSLNRLYGLSFHGMGRDLQSDPDNFAAYGPGVFWAADFRTGRQRNMPGKILLVPMDSRTTASPTGAQDYVFYGEGGWSWSIPWVAGLYALACEVQPDITPEKFWALALETGRTIPIQVGSVQIQFGTIADPVALIARLKKP